MLANRIVMIALLAAGSLGLSGCGGTDQPAAGTAVASQSWWTVVLGQVRAATGGTLEVVHDGTGWMLGKNEVTIDQVGEFEMVQGTRHATYRITVARADESFSSEIAGIECDELGIPTEQSQEKLNEAVTKIKTMLDRLQS
jgi:hypothetical protein